MKKIVIRGYYGRDNLGDELMKEIFIESLGESAELQIMNSDPQGLYKSFGIDTPEELVTGKTPSFINIIRRFITILKADLFVFGGGTILTDKHGFFHLAENAVYFLFRRAIGKKNLLISVGATEFKSKIGKTLSKLLISCSQEALIRDDDSYKLLKKLTRNSKKLICSSDMVLLTPNHLSFLSNIERNTVGVCAMPYNWATFHKNGNDLALLKKLAEQIVLIGKQTGLKFLIIPIQYGDNCTTDYEYSKQLYDILKNKVDVQFCKCKSIKQKIDVIGQCEYLISMRLHALMISALAGGKVFAVNHNEKIDYFMKRYSSTQYSVTLEEMQDIAERFLRINSDKNPINNKALAEDSKKAKRNIIAISKYIN